MSSFPNAAVLQAVYSRLNGKSELAGSVYDRPPDRTDRNYVVIGDDEFDEFDTMDSNGADGTLTIHTWTVDRNKLSCLELMEVIHGALNKYDLTVTGHHVIQLYQEYSNVTIDPDSVTYHGIQRFRILTMEV